MPSFSNSGAADRFLGAGKMNKNVVRFGWVLHACLLPTMLTGCVLQDPAWRHMDKSMSAFKAGNCEKGIEELKASANSGPDWRDSGVSFAPAAAHDLGDLYRTGYRQGCTVTPDPAQASMWYARAGDAAAAEQAADTVGQRTAMIQGLQAGVAAGSRNQTYVPPTAPSTASAYSSAGSPVGSNLQPQFDHGLNHCVSFSRNTNDYYFQNNCPVPVKIEFQCTDAATGRTEAPGLLTSVAPGSQVNAPCYLPRSNTDYAVCPDDDGIFAADGQRSWTPNTPFTCRRMQ